MEANKVAHEAAMAAYPAQHAMEATLATCATIEEALAAWQAAADAITGGGNSAPMQD